MKPHAFVPDPPRTSCKICSQSRAHSLHLAHEDVAPETDGGQRWTFIRGERP